MKVCFLLFLLQLLHRNIFVRTANSAVCFLTELPDYETLQFAEELAQDGMKTGIDVYIMIDNATFFNFSSINTSSHVTLLKIPEEDCLSTGYHHTTRLGNETDLVTAWDRALFYFCILNKNYSFVWFIENDVFIPSVQAFRSLHQLYSNTSDLIISNNTINFLGETDYWFWAMTVGRFPIPWSNSMVNVVGLSQRLLVGIANYIRWRGTSEFHEFFFNTLATKLNMTIVTPLEMDTLVYRGGYSWENISKRSNNLWHPVKESYARQIFRQRLVKERPVIENPVDLNELKTLCNSNINVTKYLIDLLAKFEISKGQLSANDRRLMREHFLKFIQHCQEQKRNDSIQIKLLARALADHAYKLPEPELEPLVKEKSSYHLGLEQTIDKTKETIFRLLLNNSNSLFVAKLRNETANLIKALSIEIRREVEEKQKLRNQTHPSTQIMIVNSTANSLPFDAIDIPKENKTASLSRTQEDKPVRSFEQSGFKKVIFVWFILSSLIIILGTRPNKRLKYIIIILIFFTSFFYTLWDRMLFLNESY